MRKTANELRRREPFGEVSSTSASTDGISRPRPISVLHIVLSTVTGGMENVIYNLAYGRDPSRLEISVGCLLEIGHLSETLRGIGVQSSLVPKMIPGLTMLYPKQLIKFIRDSHCDIVHTHSGCWTKVAAACSYIPQIKVIYTEHGRTFPESRLQVLQDRIAIRSTHKVVAVGEPLRKYLINRVGLPAEKVVTIHNGIDTERFKPSEEGKRVRDEFGYKDDEVVIAIVARLAPVKDHRYLIEAFRILLQRCPQARLLIIGDGPLREKLDFMVESYNLGEQIHFAGDRNDVDRILTGMDVATLSSQSEGISLTLLEAMSAELPVVATAVGGNITIIKDGINGFLVEVNDINTYADLLTRLTQSSDLRRRIGKEARVDVMANWSLKGMVDAYQQLYEELITPY
ncbi:MAG: hypothetical protein CO189_11670 [candidate division Zixibacteria bacterium CG_4_9_14_3_um_filter_46_8]|nr:MAG: hypothetical protein CO189_11670 [candidate division Zixibacteria bacterium CG_4_9_14_3_um_filter_46_8]